MRSQSLRDRAAAVVLPGLRHPNRTVCLGINTSVGVARRLRTEPKLVISLNEMLDPQISLNYPCLRRAGLRPRMIAQSTFSASELEEEQEE